MSKFDYYKINKDYDIINNIDIIKNIDDYKMNKENDLIYYNNFLKADSFSSLFLKQPKKVSGNLDLSTLQKLAGLISPQPIVPTKQTQTGRTPKQPSQTGRNYDASAMWSPESTAGKIYEWNRGVVGISLDGDIQKEILDGTFNHHSDATVRIASALGSPISETSAPFEAAVNCAKNGLLIFQSEGDNAFIYFPEAISEEQLNALIDVVTPRNDFNYSYTHAEQIYEEQTMDSVIEFATKLSAMTNIARR